jgi:hypothetical protein
MKQFQEFGNGGDLVRFLSGGLLGQTNAVIDRESMHHVQGFETLARIPRATQGLAIDRHLVEFQAFANIRHPRGKPAVQFFGLKKQEDPPKSVMRRQPVLQS